MKVLWTVYSGTLSGPAARATEDPVQALAWARSCGPSAFVRSEFGGERKVVWSPESDRRCAGQLHHAIINDAVAGLSGSAG